MKKHLCLEEMMRHVQWALLAAVVLLAGVWVCLALLGPTAGPVKLPASVDRLAAMPDAGLVAAREREFDAAKAALDAEIEAAGGFDQWKAATAAEDLQELHAAVLRVAKAASLEEKAEIASRLQAIAAKRAVPLNDVYRRAVDALAWRGGEWHSKTGGKPKTVDQVLDAVDASYTIQPTQEPWGKPDAYRGRFCWDGDLASAWDRARK
jgi:hypothetical protein